MSQQYKSMIQALQDGKFKQRSYKNGDNTKGWYGLWKHLDFGFQFVQTRNILILPGVPVIV